MKLNYERRGLEKARWSKLLYVAAYESLKDSYAKTKRKLEKASNEQKETTNIECNTRRLRLFNELRLYIGSSL